MLDDIANDGDDNIAVAALAAIDDAIDRRFAFYLSSISNENANNLIAYLERHVEKLAGKIQPAEEKLSDDLRSLSKYDLQLGNVNNAQAKNSKLTSVVNAEKNIYFKLEKEIVELEMKVKEKNNLSASQEEQRKVEERQAERKKTQQEYGRKLKNIVDRTNELTASVDERCEKMSKELTTTGYLSKEYLDDFKDWSTLTNQRDAILEDVKSLKPADSDRVKDVLLNSMRKLENNYSNVVNILSSNAARRHNIKKLFKDNAKKYLEKRSQSWRIWITDLVGNCFFGESEGTRRQGYLLEVETAIEDFYKIPSQDNREKMEAQFAKRTNFTSNRKFADTLNCMISEVEAQYNRFAHKMAG